MGEPWTDDHRKAHAAAMAAKRAEKQVAKELENQSDQEVLPPQEQILEKTASPEAAGDVLEASSDVQPIPAEPTPKIEPTISVTQYNDLLRQIEELKALGGQQFAQAPHQQQPQVNQRGQLIGTFEKYLIDPKNYPDPRERLSKESRLARFAFPINYELGFEVTVTQYQTQDGINTREPKFTLKLIKIVMDDDTGEPTNGRYELRTMVLHEDPQAALTVAREQNLPVDELGQKAFLDEMRYLRMRDWLIEAFYPGKVTTKKNKREMVINNRIVEYYEVSSEDSTAIDFKELHGKVK